MQLLATIFVLVITFLLNVACIFLGLNEGVLPVVQTQTCSFLNAMFIFLFCLGLGGAVKLKVQLKK